MFGGDFIVWWFSAGRFSWRLHWGQIDLLLVHPGVDPSSCLFSFWVFILPLCIFICLHSSYVRFTFSILDLAGLFGFWIFLVGGLFHEVKGLIPRLWVNSIGTRNIVAMEAMRRMLCRPNHETHDFKGSSDRCYRMMIPTFELSYSDLAFNLTLT